MTDDDKKVHLPAYPKHESGKYERREMAAVHRQSVESRIAEVADSVRMMQSTMERGFESLGRDMKAIERDVRSIEKTQAETRGDVAKVHHLVDGVHADYQRVDTRLQRHDERLDELERHRERRDGERSIIAKLDRGEAVRGLAKHKQAIGGAAAGAGGAGLLYVIVQAVAQALGGG